MARYKPLFRVLQKVIGLWLIITGGVRLAGDLLSIVWGWAREAAGSTDPIGGMTLASWRDLNLIDLVFGTIIYGGLELLLGLYLFLGATWIVNLAILSSRRQCAECGYDFGPDGAERCPECGTVVEQDDGLVRENTERSSEAADRSANEEE